MEEEKSKIKFLFFLKTYSELSPGNKGLLVNKWWKIDPAENISQIG